MSHPTFGPHDHTTWKTLYERQFEAIKRDIHPMFSRGLARLEIKPDRIPDLGEVNQRLFALTGYRGRYVDGLKEPVSFFPMISMNEFPIGNFIRDLKDGGYTPAPDVFHDLFGHLPFLADPEYAEFSRRFGEAAKKYTDRPELLVQFDRLYWFTLEFGLVRQDSRTVIFGSGIASSHSECIHALGPTPEVLPFDLDRIRRQDFRIDIMQPILFRIDSLESLYGCLPEFERLIKKPF
jgi:phenylalanine-4-hydroxylase